MRVQFWDAASNLHSHSYTGVDLSLGRWIKLKAWGLGVTFFFFSVAACGLGRVVGTKISRARTKAMSLTGFGLNCWHRSEGMGDEAAVPDGA